LYTTITEGGVFFLTLNVNDAECTLVIKPKLDIHDVYASELGQTLGMPVSPIVGIYSEHELWQPMLAALDKHGQKDLFLLENTNGGGYALLMGLANGKDLVDYTWEKAGIHAFRKCHIDHFTKAVKKVGLGPITKKVSQDKSWAQDICKFMWQQFHATSPEEAKMFWGDDKPNQPKWCPTKWRKQITEADTKKYFADPLAADVEGCATTAADAFCMSFWSKDQSGKNAKVKVKQMKDDRMCSYKRTQEVMEDIDEVKETLSDLMTDANTLLQMGQLSAFESLLRENDGIPTYTLTTSNWHNFFVAKGQVTGIDMAVGGAIDHEKIDASCDPNDLFVSCKDDVEKTVRKAMCPVDEAESNDYGSSPFVKMLRPYQSDTIENCDIGGCVKKCLNEHGRLMTNEQLLAMGNALVQSTAATFKQFAKGDTMQKALTATTAKLKLFSPSESKVIDKIEAVLQIQFTAIKEGVAAGEEACEEAEVE
jgi:hypothetical protein